MKFKVPQISDPNSSTLIFNFLSEYLGELKYETGKWPDQILFGGHLGKQVHDFIIASGWNLAEFNPKWVGGIRNFVRFAYSKPLDQIEDHHSTLFEKPLANTQITGIPSEKTISQIMASYSRPAFKIERKISPNIEVKLI